MLRSLILFCVLLAACDNTFPAVDFRDVDGGAVDSFTRVPQSCRVSGAIADTDTEPTTGACCGGHFSAGIVPRCCNGGIGSECVSDLDCCGSHTSPFVACVIPRNGNKGTCCVVGESCGPICH